MPLGRAAGERELDLRGPIVRTAQQLGDPSNLRGQLPDVLGRHLREVLARAEQLDQDVHGEDGLPEVVDQRAQPESLGHLVDIGDLAVCDVVGSLARRAIRHRDPPSASPRGPAVRVRSAWRLAPPRWPRPCG